MTPGQSNVVLQIMRGIEQREDRLATHLTLPGYKRGSLTRYLLASVLHCGEHAFQRSDSLGGFCEAPHFMSRVVEALPSVAMAAVRDKKFEIGANAGSELGRRVCTGPADKVAICGRCSKTGHYAYTCYCAVRDAEPGAGGGRSRRQGQQQRGTSVGYCDTVTDYANGMTKAHESQ